MHGGFRVAAALIGGAAVSAAFAVETPEALRAPAGQVLAVALAAKGVQVYECAAADAGKYAWKFKGPTAELFDANGRAAGKHYGGPTWEAPDGGKVVGEARASAPSSDAGSIPQLLLNAKSSPDSGVFARVRTVQRLETHGGSAPTQGCDPTKVSEVARVPYTATYLFYSEPAAPKTAY